MELTQQLAFGEPALTREGEPVRDAFASLVERRSRFVFQVAYAVLRNTGEAEDAVQETFLKLYRTGKWRGIEDERAFLARTAWRIAVGRIPKRQSDQPKIDMPAPGQDPEQAAITSNWTAIVHRLIDALPAELRQPLVLSAVENLDSKEIGLILGIPEGTARTRIMRARNTLKQKLAAWLESPDAR